MSEHLKILVVDDHPIFSEGLVTVLQLRFPDAQYTMAHSGAEAWERICQLSDYQLVITDISMREMSGLELATRIKGQFPAIKVLILSMHNERNIVGAAMDTEAEGFVLKSASALEIEIAIKEILDGNTHYSREVMAILLAKVKQEKKQDAVKILLTDREREILKLILEEYSTGEIAEKLFISKRTVDTHRANLLEKTGCHNLIALYKFAIRHHLTDPNISTTT